MVEGEPTGLGFGWTHPIAVAQFGLNGETEITVVRTPHIDPMVEFRKLTVKGFEVVGTNPPSHHMFLALETRI